MRTIYSRPQPVKRLKQRVFAHGITYERVAAHAGVSWFMVWAVLNGRKVSRKVVDAAKALLAEVPA